MSARPPGRALISFGSRRGSRCSRTRSVPLVCRGHSCRWCAPLALLPRSRRRSPFRGASLPQPLQSGHVRPLIQQQRSTQWELSSVAARPSRPSLRYPASPPGSRVYPSGTRPVEDAASHCRPLLDFICSAYRRVACPTPGTPSTPPRCPSRSATSPARPICRAHPAGPYLRCHLPGPSAAPTPAAPTRRADLLRPLAAPICRAHPPRPPRRALPAVSSAGPTCPPNLPGPVACSTCPA